MSETKVNECQAWYGADDICALPPESPIHDPRNPKGHRYIPKEDCNDSASPQAPNS